MQKPIVLYDDICLFCQRTKRRVEFFDIGNRLKWVGLSKFDHKKHGLKKDDLYKEIHIIDGKDVYKGYYSGKFIAKTVPSLWILYILMIIPGVDFVGKKVYSWIAKKRYSL